MIARFPELTAPPTVQPTPINIESGLWCPRAIEPDETTVTELDPAQPAVTAFAAMDAQHVWLQNDTQVVVALTGPHSNEADAPTYKEIDQVFSKFVQTTDGRRRYILHEGPSQAPYLFEESDQQLIREYGELAYIQKLAYRHRIPAASTDPDNESEALAVMHGWPQLARATKTYLIARVIPQIYRRQAPEWTPNELDELREVYSEFPNPERIISNIVNSGLTSTSVYLAKYTQRRLRTDRDRYHQLYSPDPVYGAGSVASAARHLHRAHDIRTTVEALCHQADEDALNQIFRCTNSPVYTTALSSTAELCDLQKVSVLINRLRDRRTMTRLAKIALEGGSLFWISGPLHFEVGQRALQHIAAKRGLTQLRTVQ